MWNSFSSETQYILKGVSKKVGGELGDACPLGFPTEHLQSALDICLVRGLDFIICLVSQNYMEKNANYPNQALLKYEPLELFCYPKKSGGLGFPQMCA